MHAGNLPHRRPAVSGLTLIELMVALAIISVLAGISLPTVKTMIEGQRDSRAASVVQAAIEAGRARSIARGGGGGILIERLGNRNIFERSQAIQIRFVDAPPVYTGDTNHATVRYRNLVDPANPLNPGIDRHVVLFDNRQAQIIRSAMDISNEVEPTLINIGNTMRLGNEGFPMTIVGFLRLPAGAPWVDWARPGEAAPAGFPNNYVTAVLAPQEAGTNLRRHNKRDMPFEIIRSPRPAIAMPSELPTGTAIDLTASGIGRYGNEFSPMEIQRNYLDANARPFATNTPDYGSILILFGARGEVSRVLATRWVVDPDGNGDPSDSRPIYGDLPLTGDIHLLVGKLGQVKPLPPDQLEDNDPNPLQDEADDGTTPLLDPDSIWVTIKARTGEVITSAWTDPTDENLPLVPAVAGTENDAQRQTRIRTVIGRVRSGAVRSQDLGSL